MTRTVLVTGSSRGLGAVIVKTLATQGFEVIINYNQSREAAEALAK
ncbi:SDR family NAD(P)-dependent oxidoreductase, partial [Clostridium perfringens]